MTPTRPPDTLVLYDGTCGFCRRSVAFAQRHGRAGLRFEPLASAAGRAALVEHGFPADFGRSVVLIHAGRAFIESAAVWRLAWRLRWPYRTLAAGRFVPRPLRNAAYRWVARNRGHFPGGCSLNAKPVDGR